ncbi:MAG: DNA polymerase I, partial [Lachnospiraceae bacterium]|nr:DNA polymerase I [Lachnospiraceae bacterium]
MGEKLVLIDGHSILNRAYYGVPELTNAEGFHTNAIYGFLNIMFKILEEEKPQYLIVAFDVKAKTFRHEMYEAYKGTRKPMPEELREQVPVMKQVLEAMQVAIVEKPGFEADDILGTLAKRAEAEGMEVSLVSGDRDLLQIATAHIKIRIPKTKGARTEVEDYYEDDVLAKYQVTPTQFIELKALMGDTADNIPGVPKIGEKTATSLLLSYQTIDGIYEHLDEITKKSVKQTLSENRHMADLSKALATICTTAELDVSFEDAKLSGLYTKEALKLFQKLEFKNMLGRFDDALKETNLALRQTYADTAKGMREILEKCRRAEYFSYYFVEGQPETASSLTPLERMMNGEPDSEIAVLGVALCWERESAAFVRVSGEITPEGLLEAVTGLVTGDRAGKAVSFDCKKSYDYIYYHTQMQEKNETDSLFDVKLAAYLINPLKSEYTLEDIAGEYASVLMESRQQLFGKQTLTEVFSENPDAFLSYACLRSYCIYASYEKLAEALRSAQMEKLFYEMEMPLTYVLYEMEKEGVLVKGHELDVYAETLTVKIEELEQKIYDTVGEPFNINSPKQLGEILFGKMNLPGG